MKKFIDGHKVAAQPYLISKERKTLYFFSNFNFEVCVKTKILYVNFTAITNKG